MDPDALDGAFRVLQQQLDAIQRLQDVVGRGERDLKVVMRDFEQQLCCFGLLKGKVFFQT